jgi:hypothetical protein
MSRRRSSTGVSDFLSDILDDIKDFVDDDVLDRARDTERDVRRGGRNLFDDTDGNRHRPSHRSSSSNSARGSRHDRDDLDELRRAVSSLAKKIGSLERNARPRSGSQLPISGYDDLTAVEVNERLTSLSQTDLGVVDDYERAHANRSTVTGRIETLRESEPWSGYDDHTVVEVRKKLVDADASRTREVRAYEARHKNRQGVLDATDTAPTS